LAEVCRHPDEADADCSGDAEHDERFPQGLAEYAGKQRPAVFKLVIHFHSPFFSNPAAMFAARIFADDQK
jgi:hypothetical protein